MTCEDGMGAFDDVKKWADKNRVISGALTGLAAGTIVPGVGNVVGALAGAGIGFLSKKEKEIKTEDAKDVKGEDHE